MFKNEDAYRFDEMKIFKNVYKYDDWKRREHEAVRNTVGWYYFTHHLVEVTGKDAAAFLDLIYLKPISNLEVSRARYTTMLNEQAQILDDVVVFRLEENKFWVSTLYAVKLTRWLDTHKGDYDVTYEIITDQWDMYAVQGPKSKDLVNALVEKNIDDQKFFQILDNKIDDIPVKINRGGFTGEKVGYEIYVSPAFCETIEAKLAETGKDFGAVEVQEFQIMALSLPTEKGFYLMADIQWANPFEVGLADGVDWNKDFIGKEALLKIKEEGPKRTLLGFITDEDDVHIHPKDRGGSGHPVLMGGEEVGRVTKFTYGYISERSIGFALVDADKAKIGDRIVINGYSGTLTERVFA
ncbi:MAG: aminomethyltransferase family protein [Coriobacteriales bacterium]|jgi:aminomethyltransferase|nr:aminomethyltransferase family protein [Coriobacteriales bacterium]